MDTTSSPFFKNHPMGSATVGNNKILEEGNLNESGGAKRKAEHGHRGGDERWKCSRLTVSTGAAERKIQTVMEFLKSHKEHFAEVLPHNFWEDSNENDERGIDWLAIVCRLSKLAKVEEKKSSGASAEYNQMLLEYRSKLATFALLSQEVEDEGNFVRVLQKRAAVERKINSIAAMLGNLLSSLQPHRCSKTVDLLSLLDEIRAFESSAEMEIDGQNFEGGSVS